MSLRLLGVLTVLLLSLGLAGPAAAAESGGTSQGEGGATQEGGHGGRAPSIEEIGSGSEVSRQFFPEEYEQPPWFQWLLYPLLIAGVVMALLLLFAYLRWQPDFARERRSKKRR